MKAVYYNEFGDKSVLKFGDMPKPCIGSKDVLIETRAAGLNPVDAKIREGMPVWPVKLPVVVGWDIAGVVVEVGAECDRIKVGDAVYAYNRPVFEDPEIAIEEGSIGPNGCCAEYVKVAEWKVAFKPKTVSFSEAGGIPLAALTAFQGLFDIGGLQKGQNVVIFNASGGVGSFAVQLAKNAGCNVVGTCGSRNIDAVGALGCSAVDYSKNNVVNDIRALIPEGADLVLDCIGGDQSAHGIEVLKPEGKIVSIANFNIQSDAAAVGKVGAAFLVKVSGSQLEEISALVDAGLLKVLSVQEHTLSSAVDAFAVLESGHSVGKIVLTSSGPTDPRLLAFGDRRMVQLMSLIGAHTYANSLPISAETLRENMLNHFSVLEKMFALGDGILFPASMKIPEVVRETVTIKGVDGNDIDLFISSPMGQTEPLPCIYRIHGGGMAISHCNYRYDQFTRDRLAALGMVVVGVQFRNSAGELGPHQYPVGLNDCMSGLEWVHKHRDARLISKIIVCGESGGGNLSIACGIRAKKEGKLQIIDGVYAMCPFIYGRYGRGDEEDEKLPSLKENDGLFLLCKNMGFMADMYLPEGAHASDYPMAWPYWASESDVEGLPPHVISLNELDPLFCEGLAYYRKLNRAGVTARCRTVHGTAHSAEILFMHAIPEIWESTANDILLFAKSL